VLFCLLAKEARSRASQVLDRGAEAVARDTDRFASLVLDHGAQAGAQAVACGDVELSQHKTNTRQMNSTLKRILRANTSAQRQDTPRA
jgi:hypothetical protein